MKMDKDSEARYTRQRESEYELARERIFSGSEDKGNETRKMDKDAEARYTRQRERERVRTCSRAYLHRLGRQR